MEWTYSGTFFSSTRRVSGGAAMRLSYDRRTEPILLAEITGLTDAQDYRFEKAVETAENLLRRDFLKFQAPMAYLTGSRSVSFPMPCEPPSTSAWLTFS